MRHTWKGTAVLVAGGLLLAGLAYAATNPSLTPIAAVRQPNATVKSVTGSIKTLGTSSLVVHTRKADYTFALDATTTYYLGNGVPATVADLRANDTVTVWSLSLTDGSAIKVWDKRSFAQPSVSIVTLSGSIAQISTSSITITADKTAKAYTQIFNPQTKFYTRDGKSTESTFLKVGDTVVIQTLRATDGVAINVWDRKIWTGSLTRTISALVLPTAPGRILEGSDVMNGSFTLTKANVTSVFNVQGLANTTVSKGADAKGWSDLANGTVVKVSGMWNDTQKVLYATSIAIQ